MKIIKKLILILMIGIINITTLTNITHAANINSANLYSSGVCPALLKFKGSPVTVTYVKYDNNGESYPAYCLDKDLPGVTAENPYTVNVSDAITDVKLWRVIVNGFPYKSIAELGCVTEQEAFTATKQAIYCYLYSDTDPEDYEGIGVEGQRTLNALKSIVTNAANSTETKVSNKVTIQAQGNNWQQDETEPEYISKYYTASADARIRNYTVELEKIEKNLPEGIKITDRHNEEKNQFVEGQLFKIMIPICKIKEAGNFKIKVTTAVKTKPVLYGTAPNTGLQDYAVTVASYEDSVGNKIDEYQKNETKIIIEKQDEETKEKLKDVEFEILNDKKEVVYTNLKTNEEGRIEIENVVPGTYYIRETKTLDGYLLNEELTQIDIAYNEVITVEINNKKDEKPKTTIEKTSKKIEAKKLPVTGM